MLVDPDGLVIVCVICVGIGFAIGWVGGFMEAIQRRREFDAKLRALGVKVLPQLDAATVKAGEPEDVRAWLDSRRADGVIASEHQTKTGQPPMNKD